MVDALLVVAIGLGVLCFRRLGLLLTRDEESHVYLEAGLEDRIRSGMKEIARSVQEETAASVASLSDSLLAELAQSRLALEKTVEALAKQVVESSRASGERLEVLAKQVARASGSSGEALDAIGRQTSEEAQRTRRELLEALTALQPTLSEALGEMRALHEQAVRELRRPIRHAVAIRQEIRKARDQHAKQAHEPWVGRSEVAEAVWMENEVDRILGPAKEGEGPAVPDARVREPMQPEPSQAEPQVAAPRRLAGLLRRMRRRARNAASTRVDRRAGH